MKTSQTHPSLLLVICLCLTALLFACGDDGGTSTEEDALDVVTDTEDTADDTDQSDPDMDVECTSGEECESGVCDAASGTCLEPTCMDEVANGDESDVDCGGSCSACPANSMCGIDADCASGVCGDDSLCDEAACDDMILNGSESDVDCGGSVCDACPAESACNSNPDCRSGVCSSNVCVDAQCMDMVQNGDETDEDCGGPDCAACEDGLGCVENTDCVSGVCNGFSCAEPACDDMVQNGDETGLDCGGPDCDGCGAGEVCNGASDCGDGILCDTDNNACVWPESCQAILEAGISTGDGTYTIDPDGPAGDISFDVYCDMTTDGGGWTAIGPDLVINTTRDDAGTSFRTARTDVGGTGLCQVADMGQLRGRGTGDLHCRFDFDVGFEFNTMRTGTGADAVVMEVDGGPAPFETDLTRVADSWGTNGCTGAGDVHFGTAAHPGGQLSLGAYDGTAACGTPHSEPDQYQFIWEDAFAHSTPDTVLRLEFSENDSEDEGWRWEAGRIFVRHEIDFSGTYTAGDAAIWEDGTIAANCAEYKAGTGLYASAYVDGVYEIDPAQDGNTIEVYCDMNRNGGGWMRVVNWDREFGTDDLASFRSVMTQDFDNMGQFDDKNAFIRWSDADSTYDAMAYHVDTTIPNNGELLLDVHFEGISNEVSAVWFFATAGGTQQNILCWDDVSGGNQANYSTTEQSYIPADFTCPNNNPPLSNATWTWNQLEEVTLSGEVTSFHIHGLQGDCCVDGGDSSDLYRFDVYVR